MGESHKLAFNDSLTMYSKPLELAATDLWGPAPICLDYGYKYYISFIDALSRYTWIYFLKSKSETCNVVVHFISLVEKQTGCQVKIMQTVCGTAYSPLSSFFNKKGNNS
jgi:hypothetical protein